MAHVCHALECRVPIPPRLFMCRAHWFAVTPALRRAVWAAYSPGQEVTKQTTQAYRQAAARAIIAVAEQEGRTIPAVWRRMAAGHEAALVEDARVR